MSAKLNQPTHDEATARRGRAGITRPQLALQARPEHVVVDQRPDDEQGDERGLEDQRAVEVGRERRRVEAAVKDA